jgi:hypothetical protein
MAADLQTPKDIEQFCFTLIPLVEGPNSFFSNAARALLQGVMKSFAINTPYTINSPEHCWFFFDIILATRSDVRLRKILGRNRRTKYLIAKYLDAREASSILAELDTHLSPFESIAACWSKATPLSLTEFVESESVLILPYDERVKAQLLLLNGLIFRFLTQQLLGQMTNEQLRAEGKRLRQTVIFIDEARDVAGKFGDSLRSLLTRGRAYGIGNVLGWQSNEGLIDETNPHQAPEIVGLSTYISMLRVIEPETANYLVSILDKREVFRKSQGGQQLVTEPVLLPTALAEFPQDKLHSYNVGPEPYGLWKSETPWPERKPRPVTTPLDFIGRPKTDEDLQDWNIDALKRLKLPLHLFEEEEKAAKKKEEGDQKKGREKTKETIDTPEGQVKKKRYPRQNR